MIRWIALLAAALAVAGCANTPPVQHTAAADSQWNGGVWNSVLGYHGPANAVVTGGPSGR